MNKEALKSIYAYNMLFNTSSGTNADEDVKFNTDLISDFDLQNFDAKRFEYYTTLLKTFDNDRDTLMNVLNKYNSVKSLRVKEKEIIREIKDYVNKINSAQTVGGGKKGKKRITAKDLDRKKKAIERLERFDKSNETKRIDSVDEPKISNKIAELIIKCEEIKDNDEEKKKFIKYLEDLKKEAIYFENKKATDLEAIENFEKRIDDFEEFINSYSFSGGGFISDASRKNFLEGIKGLLDKSLTTGRLPSEILSQAKKIIEFARREVEKAIEIFDKKDEDKPSYFKKRLLELPTLKNVLEAILNAEATSKLANITNFQTEVTTIENKATKLEKIAEKYDLFAKYRLEMANKSLDSIEGALALLPSNTRDKARELNTTIDNKRDYYRRDFENKTKEAHEAVEAITVVIGIGANPPALEVRPINAQSAITNLTTIEGAGLVIMPAALESNHKNNMKDSMKKRSELVNIAMSYSRLVADNNTLIDIPSIIKLQNEREKIRKIVEKAKDDVLKIESVLNNIKKHKEEITKKKGITIDAMATMTILRDNRDDNILDRQKRIKEEYKNVEEALEKARSLVEKVEDQQADANKFAKEVDDGVNRVVTDIDVLLINNTDGILELNAGVQNTAYAEALIYEERKKLMDKRNKNERKENRRIRKEKEEKEEEEEEEEKEEIPEKTISVIKNGMGRSKERARKILAAQAGQVAPGSTIRMMRSPEPDDRSQFNWTSSSTDSVMRRSASSTDSVIRRASSGGAKAEEKYSDDTLKAQYLDKQRYINISPIIKDEFRSVKDENNGKLVRIKTENKIDQLSNDIETYNALSIQDREANKENIIKKIKDFENDPQNPLEELEITIDDRIVFIITTFFIRYITILMVQWCIDINIIKSFYEGFIYYAIIYIILFWFVVLFINIDNSYDVKYMNFNGIINSIRSLFYYFYMGTNGISRLLIHTSLILLLIVIPIILNIKKKPEFKDETNDEDTITNAKILNYEERKQLSKTLSLFTIFIWLFTSIIATKF